MGVKQAPFVAAPTLIARAAGCKWLFLNEPCHHTLGHVGGRWFVRVACSVDGPLAHRTGRPRRATLGSQGCDASTHDQQEPRDLHTHRLGLYSGYPTRDRWTFHHGGAELTTYLMASLLTNSVHLLREYALEHAGIVCLPTLVAGDAILRGDLTVVVPAHQLSSFSLSAVYAATSRNAFKLKLFVENIASEFGRVPPWDLALIQQGLIPEAIVMA